MIPPSKILKLNYRTFAFSINDNGKNIVMNGMVSLIRRILIRLEEKLMVG